MPPRISSFSKPARIQRSLRITCRIESGTTITATITMRFCQCRAYSRNASPRISPTRRGLSRLGLPGCSGSLGSIGSESIDPVRAIALRAPRTLRPVETRKTVTVLFADVTGSTALGERLDPESLRGVMSRYFEEMRSAIESHGGTVEKFIGDAVMAVFGVPTVHEDDALRAVRAASQMRDLLDVLNTELERDWGARLQIRTGVNTGEVIAGDPSSGQSFVTGDTVNVAARLEQAAEPGEILIGAVTRDLVRDAVEVKAAESLRLKGKTDLVPAFRLLDVAPGPAFARRLDSPLVGREDELGRLETAFGDAVMQRACRMATVGGAAGLGKSRLVTEFVTRVGDRARTLWSRCLPYGEGITFWPVTELVWAAGGIGEVESPEVARDKVRALVAGAEDGDTIAELIESAI